jgi:hypothetical protein
MTPAPSSIPILSRTSVEAEPDRREARDLRLPLLLVGECPPFAAAAELSLSVSIYVVQRTHRRPEHTVVRFGAANEQTGTGWQDLETRMAPGTTHGRGIQ